MEATIEFIKTKLNNYLIQMFGDSAGTVGFLSAQNWDPIVFADQQITMLIVNLEEDKIMRPDHLYRRKNEKGILVDVYPEIKLNVYILFVAKFGTYNEAWKQIFAIIRYFQANRLFSAESEPGLPSSVQQLIFELSTLSFSEQNELWSMLKVAYHPSVLYRAKLFVLQNEMIILSPEVRHLNSNLSHQ